MSKKFINKPENIVPEIIEVWIAEGWGMGEHAFPKGVGVEVHFLCESPYTSLQCKILGTQQVCRLAWAF